jgi:hypothetical protein
MTRERLGTTLVVGELEITPVELVSLRRIRLGDALVFVGSKRPIAIRVREGGREWTIEIEGEGEGS